MVRTNWDPAAFHHWYEKLPARKREFAWSDLTSAHRKTYIEWKTFRGFAKVSELDIDPRSIEMCEPNAASPPCPDLRCLVSGELAHFELGEVTSEDLARKANRASKNRRTSYGGVVNQRQPLLRIFLKKCRNRYTTNGRPLHLVLHFLVGRQSPFEPQLSHDVERCRARLVERIRRSQFASVSLYDDWKQRVLVRLQP